MSKHIEVAAGLIFRNGDLLIAQRPKGVHLEGLWEFPGGKREAGETFEDCLVRELREELGCDVRIKDQIHEVQHDYPEKSVVIRFFRCSVVSGQPKPLECASLEWVSPETMHRFTFPDADQVLIELLSQHPEWWR